MRHNISLVRHGFITDYDPQPGVSISTLAWEYPPAFRVPEHAHGAGQIIYAISGVMEVTAGQSFWLIPPQFAIWIPPRVWHHIRMPGAVSMRTLYLRRSLTANLPAGCRVIHVTRLAAELISEAVRRGNLRWRSRLDRALRDLILWELEHAPAVPVSLTLPKDPRALAVARAALEDQSKRVALPALCNGTASVRTIERLFRAEVGVDFATWRRQARLMKALELLAGGASVKHAAYAIGYQQPSAFVQTFRRTFGDTPRAWASGRTSAAASGA